MKVLPLSGLGLPAVRAASADARGTFTSYTVAWTNRALSRPASPATVARMARAATVNRVSGRARAALASLPMNQAPARATTGATINQFGGFG